MTPGALDLPTIWIGSDYAPIKFSWKDPSGNPIDLTGWSPFAQANNIFDLNAVVTDAPNGLTQISMPKEETSLLKIADVSWDWLWQRDSPVLITPPVLSGKIPIRQPTTVITQPPG